MVFPKTVRSNAPPLTSPVKVPRWLCTAARALDNTASGVPEKAMENSQAIPLKLRHIVKRPGNDHKTKGCGDSPYCFVSVGLVLILAVGSSWFWLRPHLRYYNL